MEKNQQIIGLFLMSILLLAYMWFFSPEPEELQTTPNQPVETEQITQKEKALQNAKANPLTQLSDSVRQQQFGVFAAAMAGVPSTQSVENNDIKVTFNTKGGVVSEVLLKNYVTNSKKKLILLDEQSSFLKEIVNTPFGIIDLNQLHYESSLEGNRLTLEAKDANGSPIVRKIYVLQEKGFQLNYDVELLGQANALNESSIKLNWLNYTKKLERDLEQSRIRSTVNFYTVENEVDYPTETSKEFEEMTAEQPVKWIAMKQKFFNSAIITDKAFSSVRVSTDVDESDTTVVKIMEASLNIPLQNGSTLNSGLRYYFGPNDYHICEEVTEGFEENVYLGWSFFSSINLYLVMPLFEFLENYITNYGIIILILVFIVKMALFPLTYRSYKSMAKMKVLKPEIDEIKERVGDDQMQVQQETMKLYNQVGVSPLSGCIPLIAQMPVFLAMYNFFPNAIQLRQESFLWATDLSSYDSIYDLPFTIPFYGDHVSLFTLLMAASTIVYTYFNNQMSSASLQGPMKNIGYITPLFFMVFLNSFSAGLTYYYFVSNIITIGQQVLIRRFVDEEKIRDILMKNKKKNANKNTKKSKFQQKLDEAMKQSQERSAAKAAPKKETNHKNDVEGSIKMLGNNGRAQVEVEIKNNSGLNLAIEYEIPSAVKRVNIGAGKVKKQRFQLKNVEEKDLKIDIIKAVEK